MTKERGAPAPLFYPTERRSLDSRTRCVRSCSVVVTRQRRWREREAELVGPSTERGHSRGSTYPHDRCHDDAADPSRSGRALAVFRRTAFRGEAASNKRIIPAKIRALRARAAESRSRTTDRLVAVRSLKRQSRYPDGGRVAANSAGNHLLPFYLRQVASRLALAASIPVGDAPLSRVSFSP